MPHCINTKSQEFIDLLQATKLKEPILRAKIGLWQQRNNNYDAYPTSEQILYPQVIKEINFINFPEYKPDTKVQEKYFSFSRVRKSSTLLNNIANSSNPLNELAKHLFDFSSINNVNVILDNVDSYQQDKIKVSGYYNPFAKEIRIAKNGKVAKGASENLILHEILHALSYEALRRDGIYTKTFRELYSYSLSKFGEFNPETKEGYYGNYTIDEFFVALFTDSAFIKKLQETEPMDKKQFNNLLQEVFDHLLKLLKLDNNPSLYNQAFSVATNILQSEKEYLDDLEKRMIEGVAFVSEIMTDKPIKEGVAEVFEQNPELLFIGTAQEYSDYLDTIFPDSKVKDIVYHNTDNIFEKFQSIPIAKFFTKSPLGGRKYRLPIVLNITNPKVFNEFNDDDELTYGLAEMYDKSKERDSIINGTEGQTQTEYVVFDPEQIHILGGEEDMQKFQEYMDFKNNVKDYFNLNEEESKFVQDNSNLNFNC